jgi:hypothetical protein
MATDYRREDEAKETEANPFEDLGDDALAGLIRNAVKSVNELLQEANRRKIRVAIRHRFPTVSDTRDGEPGYGLEVERITTERPL